MTHVQIKVLTPHEIVLDSVADMILLPGIDGEFGVLYGHEKMVSALQIGMLKIHIDGKVESIFIAGGIAEIQAESCCVMVDDALRSSAVNKMRIQEQLAQLQIALSSLEKEGFESKSLSEQVKFLECIIAIEMRL